MSLLYICLSALLVLSGGHEDPFLSSISDSDLLPIAYREIIEELSTTVPLVNRNAVNLASFTPFCHKFQKPRALPKIAEECVRWEEHELDMMLMFIDLMATGMEETLAKNFYKEIRCLSRAHIREIPEFKAWEVCFHYDYSAVIGGLLSKYVKEDDTLLQDKDTLKTSSRWGMHSFLFNMFSDGQYFRVFGIRNQQKETSCCVACPRTSHFVNLEAGDCESNPFGRHCCHKACKSLGRLKVGASSGTSFCCKRCLPMSCRQ